MEKSDFWVLLTPYETYPVGRTAAHRVALDQLSLLDNAGIAARSPIVEKVAGVKDESMLSRAKGVIVCNLPGVYPKHIGGTKFPPNAAPPGYENSIFYAPRKGEEELHLRPLGLEEEIEYFRVLGRPVLFMDPGIPPTKEQLEMPSKTRLIDDGECRDLANALKKSVVYAMDFFDSRTDPETKKWKVFSEIFDEMKLAVSMYNAALSRNEPRPFDEMIELRKAIRKGIGFFRAVYYSSHDKNPSRNAIFEDTRLALLHAMRIYNHAIEARPVEPTLVETTSSASPRM